MNLFGYAGFTTFHLLKVEIMKKWDGGLHLNSVTMFSSR